MILLYPILADVNRAIEFGDYFVTDFSFLDVLSRPPDSVPPYLSHLVEPFITYYNATEAPNVAGEKYMYYNLARLLIRLLDRDTYSSSIDAALPLTFLENSLGYFELNPVLPIQFPSGVKMMVKSNTCMSRRYSGELRADCLNAGTL